MNVMKMLDLDLNNKRVLIREDFNVPVEKGTVTDDQRIKAALPTIKHALAQNAAVILISHFGRPTEGEADSKYSLAPIAKRLSELLEQEVVFETNWLNGVAAQAGQVILCENTRFNHGEKANDDLLAKKMAALCDVFVMDAFATAHRAQASTHGVARFAPIACAGPLLVNELVNLHQALVAPKHPLTAIVGGSKVSTKLELLQSLINKVDQLIVGGGIANTLLAASGFPVGKSLYEADLIDDAKRLLETAKAKGAQIPLPEDVVVAKEFSADTLTEIKAASDVEADDLILDIGPKTIAQYKDVLLNSSTIVWNGPVGVFEFDIFAAGTKALAQIIAESSAYSIAGGGDTLAAMAKFNVVKQISYTSTGGGAFLEFLEGKTLPAIAILEQRCVELQT